MLTSTLPPPGKKIRAEGKSPLWAGLVRGVAARNPSKPRIAWMVDETGKPDVAALVQAYAPMVKRLALRLDQTHHAALDEIVELHVGRQAAHEAQGLSLIHISEPTRPERISYAVFCLKKKKIVTL